MKTGDPARPSWAFTKQGGRKGLMAKSKKYLGVYSIEGRKGTSYGIDYVHPRTGQRVRKILKNATSESEANTLRSIEIADAARGATDAAYGIKRQKYFLFTDALDLYLEWSTENKKSWQTDEHKAKPLRRAFSGIHMADISAFAVERYKSDRAKEVEKITVNKELILGCQVYKKAIQWGKHEGENPFSIAPKFKIPKSKKPGSLTPDEAQAIMDEITHPVKKDMVLFACLAGWRISEIRKLKWADVDVDHGTAWIMDPKNSQSVEIELSDEAVKLISRQEKKGDHVFCYKNGREFKSNLHKVIKRAAARAGVELPPRKAWHIFRRTWASMMLQNGCDVETLRVLGNWKDYSMPMWYADAAGRSRKKAILDKLPEMFNGRKKAEIQKVVKLNG
jgi:integrase